MSPQAKKRLAFDATPELIQLMSQRAAEAGMSRQRYMEMLLFGDLIPDARYKHQEQGELPMTG